MAGMPTELAPFDGQERTDVVMLADNLRPWGYHFTRSSRSDGLNIINIKSIRIIATLFC